MPRIDVNGVKLLYKEGGTPTAPPCVLMHGGLGLGHTHMTRGWIHWGTSCAWSITTSFAASLGFR